MRQAVTEVGERMLKRPTPDYTFLPTLAPTTKEIPYDYVATFILRGERGHRVQDVLNISTEGAFVAVSIGYSFIPANLPPPALRKRTMALPRAFLALMQAETAKRVAGTEAEGAATPDSDVLDLWAMAVQILTRLCGISFRYSIIDSGSGRELQNKPVHNIAGLGEATGARPFFPLPKPMVYLPRSSIRIEVEEISEGLLYVGTELTIVLHGYKILGYGAGTS